MHRYDLAYLLFLICWCVISSIISPIYKNTRRNQLHIPLRFLSFVINFLRQYPSHFFFFWLTVSLELPTFQYADSFKSTIITGKNIELPFLLYLQCYSAIFLQKIFLCAHFPLLPILFAQQVQFPQLRTQPVKGMKQNFSNCHKFLSGKINVQRFFFLLFFVMYFNFNFL